MNQPEVVPQLGSCISKPDTVAGGRQRRRARSKVVQDNVRERRKSDGLPPAMFRVVQRIGRTRERRSGAFHEKSDAGTERDRVEDVLPVAVPRERVRAPGSLFAGMRDADKGVGGVLGAGKSMRVAEIVLQAGTQDSCRCGPVNVDDRVRLECRPAECHGNAKHRHEVIDLHGQADDVSPATADVQHLPPAVDVTTVQSTHRRTLATIFTAAQRIVKG